MGSIFYAAKSGPVDAPLVCKGIELRFLKTGSIKGMGNLRSVYFLVTYVLASSVALAVNFTISKSPLTITNTGAILAPERMVHPTEYATILEEGRIKHFTHILLSRGEPISAKGDDGVFRQVSLDASTGALKFSGDREISDQETLEEFKKYFIALNMERDAGVQKFMEKHFGVAEEKPAQPEGEEGSKDSNSNSKGPDIHLESEPSQTSNEPPTAPRPIAEAPKSSNKPDGVVCDPETGICTLPNPLTSQLPPLTVPKSDSKEEGDTDGPTEEQPAAPQVATTPVQPTPPAVPKGAAIPRRIAGGMVEVGPVRGADLHQVWEKAKQLGFKHIITRFGNDSRCSACQQLGEDLRETFGGASDVLVVKVEDGIRNPRINRIPQSELISLNAEGQWRQHGELQIGSNGAADKFKRTVDGIRSRSAPRVSSGGGHSTGSSSQGRVGQGARSLSTLRAPSTVTPKPSDTVQSGVDFECVQSEGGYRPRHKEFKKPLGAGTMPSLEICQKAIQVSKNGIVCSATGLTGGYKPTFLKGVTPSRPDYGYVGGSSMTLSACLFATANSSSTHVCYYGGNSGVMVGNENTPSWYATHPTGDRSSKGGPFNTLKQCVASYGGAPRIAQRPPEAQPATPPPTPPATRGINLPEPQQIPQPQTQAQPERPKVHVTPSATQGHQVVQTQCNNCHGKTERSLPSWLAQPGELERRLASSNATERNDANRVVQHLDRVLNVENSMPPREDLKRAFDANPEAQKFKAWISDMANKSSGHQSSSTHFEGAQTTPRATASVRPANNSVKLLSPEKERLYRSILPRVENPELAAIFKDPNTIFYDKGSMVPGYQDPSTPVVGVRTTEPGFKGAGFASGANGLYLNSDGHLNMFHNGVGLEGAGNTGTFHFLNLPKDAQGNLQKIKVIKRIVPPDDAVTYDWIFPVGTVSGEVVVNKDAAGKLQVLEVRTRKKDSSNGAWAPDIMRPFPTASSLKEQLQRVAEANPNLKSEAQGLLNHLNNPNRIAPISIPRQGYQKGDFASSGGTDVLPNMSSAMVNALLATPFKSSLGAEWDRNGSTVAFAPTTKQAAGIVPQNAKSGATRVDRQSCAKCHEDTNRPIFSLFNENHPQFYSSIRAYGNLPGSDRNLRFTIFDQSQYPKFGLDGHGDNRRINPKLAPILDF